MARPVPSTVTVYPSGSRSPFAPLVAVVTLRLPVVGPVGAQLTEKVVFAVLPAVTHTVREVPTFNVQLPPPPLSNTDGLPGASPPKVVIQWSQMARPLPTT